MRIISFNVNGLRARIKNGFEEAIAKMDPDILCLQEVRAKPEQLPESLFLKYYHSIHEKAGYAGAATYSYEPPENIYTDFPLGNEKGRVIITEYANFFLLNVYVPNSGQNLEKIDHRIEWQKKLADFISTLTKPVILCGDMNCAYQAIDVGCPSIKSGTSVWERSAYKDLLDLGLVDVFRELNPDKVEYTWYSNRYKEKNPKRGMRIDAFLISRELLPLVKNIIQVQDADLVCGSDHVPVILCIDI